MRKYLPTPKLLSVYLKTALSFSLTLILMLVNASALAANGDEALITDTLRQAGITEPVQLSQWGDTAACFAGTDGVKRLILLERHDGTYIISMPSARIQIVQLTKSPLDRIFEAVQGLCISSPAVASDHPG